MTCIDCAKLLQDYLHGELDAATDARVYAHLQGCAQCRAAEQVEAEISDALKAAYGDEHELPMSVVAGVRMAMRSTTAPTFLSRLQRVMRPAFVAPAAAAALLIVGIAHYGVGRPPHPSSLSPTQLVRAHVAQTLGSPTSDRAWATYLLTSANTVADQNRGAR
jgi:anti-sigma factor RsiW